MTDPSRTPPAATFRRPTRGRGRALLGVCAGLARRWDLEPGTVRAAFLVTLVPFGAGLLVYLALAVVMPADGASERDAGRRGELGRSLVQALVVLAAVFVVGVIGATSTLLAVFGLGSIALLLASASLAAVIFTRHDRLWLLGILTLALAIPAAVVQLSDVTVARQGGQAVVRPFAPAEIAATGYRAGAGPMLIDLRDFVAPTGSTTQIRARADLRTLVVALPADRCVNLVVDYRLGTTWVARLVNSYRPRRWIPSAQGYPPTSFVGDTGRTPPVPALVAYGDAIAGQHGHYERPSRQPSAPTIHLQLESGRSQVIVRDFPNDIAPLADPTWPSSDPPQSLTTIARDLVVYERSHRATGLRAYGAAVSKVLRRQVWAQQQAIRLAGRCAAPAQVRRIRRALERDLAAQERSNRRVVQGSPLLEAGLAAVKDFRR